MSNITSENPLATQKLLTEIELARRLNMSVQWVRAARYNGEGPYVTRIGRSVRYHIDDVREYEQRCRALGMQEYPVDQ